MKGVVPCGVVSGGRCESDPGGGGPAVTSRAGCKPERGDVQRPLGGVSVQPRRLRHLGQAQR